MQNDKNGSSEGISESGLSAQESQLLNSHLPHDLSPAEMEQAWDRYQAVIGQLLIRMGKENKLFDSITRTPMVTSFKGIYARVALLPLVFKSVLRVLGRHRVSELVYRVAGECSLMELSAAAGYRTFCFPELVKGLLKTGKMKARSVHRMIDTFDFLNTMFQHSFNDHRVLQHIERTNGLHAKYKVAGPHAEEARDLFKYIALNMFYIGPRMRHDLTPEERHAICGLTVLVSKRMGHSIDGTVMEFEAFIQRYEATEMFDRDDESVLRTRAIEIAQASKNALDEIPTISPSRIHSYVPYTVKKILKIE
ncbi:MAG: hypothetical protein K2W95_17995 [Candidatus Obscuribacterales bacterium]|nr:hypothetical protein [Candidatus Obscuribacterales bacterium]